MSQRSLQEKPRLRPVDAFPTEANGQTQLVLRDPQALAREAIVVSPVAAYLLNLMDGKHTLDDIRNSFFKQFQAPVAEEDILHFVEQLDAYGFLQSQAFQERVEKMRRDYAAQSLRPPICAGTAYPAEPQALIKYLDALLGSSNPLPAMPAGIISPHIDYQRGRRTYTVLWSKLRGLPAPDAVVIFGTSHYDSENLFVISQKPYSTPLRTSPLPHSLSESLAQALGDKGNGGDFSHRSEHSIELQTLLVQHLFGEVPVLPILCGSLEVWESHAPSYRQAAEKLRAWYQEASCKKNLLCIAGADLSHIGTMFGDLGQLDSGLLQWLAAEDRASLELVCQGKADAFLQHVLRNQTKRKICGLSPIYFLLQMLGNCRGEILEYDQWVDPGKTNTVTFAASLLYTYSGAKESP